MKADPRFRNAGPDFWANVRAISQALLYVHGSTKHRQRSIKKHDVSDMARAMKSSGLKADHLLDPTSNQPTPLAAKLVEYFEYRANLLEDQVRPNLMCSVCAQRKFQQLKKDLGSVLPVPMNKQSKEKAKPLYLTGIINMLIENVIGERPCDYNPGVLTTFTRSDAPLKTLSRRHDGGFPSAVNPIAIWEIKEYYYTTTFGSKISDSVYITQLDGLEVEEARAVGVDVQFILMVDAYFTWWVKGISYLCRLIDLLNMGYVDEVLFGAEVFDRIPEIAQRWSDAYDAGMRIVSAPAEPVR